MKLSESIKPISYFKANAADIIRKLNQDHGTMIITLNGEAKAVIQDIEEYEQVVFSLREISNSTYPWASCGV